MIEMKCISCLEKIFPSTNPALVQTKYSMLANEKFSFQVVFKSTQTGVVELRIKSDLEPYLRMYTVELAPSIVSKMADSDDYLIFNENSSTLYPDILMPYDGKFTVVENHWQSVWVTVESNQGLPVGNHTICFEIGDYFVKDTIATTEYNVEVLDASLTKSNLIYTNWLHYDSISAYYNTKVFSKKFDVLLENYIKNAVNHGMNMLFTPLFTPPLDTAPNIYRRTVQLVDVEVHGDSYSFDFSRLKRFMDKARELGIEYFEMSHLTTQWGAEFTPKIIARKNKKKVRIFGWDKKSTSHEYLNFLDCFLPQLTKFLSSAGYSKKCFFHISDEPNENYVATYECISKHIKKHLVGYPIMDALSDPVFYEKGLIDLPISATEYISDFIKKDITAWAYYCGEQHRNNLSNRLFNMPSLRNRIIGIQLYLNDIRGFLHWGYNFYNSYLSRTEINPYVVTDAGKTYLSGDSFIVYPGKKEPINSLRHEVFFDAIQDYRLLCSLECKIGKEKVKKILSEEGIEGFEQYPHDETWFLNLRDRLNRLLVS